MKIEEMSLNSIILTIVLKRFRGYTISTVKHKSRIYYYDSRFLFTDI